jgi:dihydrofolate reductase
MIMRKLLLYMTMTLDGFIAGPDNELDWMSQIPDPGLNADIVSLLRSVDAGFLGYPVAQGMIPYWAQVAAEPSSSPGARAVAEAVNRLHSIVISNRPVELPFQDCELIVARDDAELVAAVDDIKRRPGRDLGLPGGVRTAQTFVRLGLVDEFVLQVHPVAIGAGRRLFSATTQLELIGAKSYESGVTRLRYLPA